MEMQFIISAATMQIRMEMIACFILMLAWSAVISAEGMPVPGWFSK